MGTWQGNSVIISKEFLEILFDPKVNETLSRLNVTAANVPSPTANGYFQIILSTCSTSCAWTNFSAGNVVFTYTDILQARIRFQFSASYYGSFSVPFQVFDTVGNSIADLLNFVVQRVDIPPRILTNVALINMEQDDLFYTLSAANLSAIDDDLVPQFSNNLFRVISAVPSEVFVNAPSSDGFRQSEINDGRVEIRLQNPQTFFGLVQLTLRLGAEAAFNPDYIYQQSDFTRLTNYFFTKPFNGVPLILESSTRPAIFTNVTIQINIGKSYRAPTLIVEPFWAVREGRNFYLNSSVTAISNTANIAAADIKISVQTPVSVWIEVFRQGIWGRATEFSQDDLAAKIVRLNPGTLPKDSNVEVFLSAYIKRPVSNVTYTTAVPVRLVFVRIPY